jgi:hypothetical protein
MRGRAPNVYNPNGALTKDSLGRNTRVMIEDEATSSAISASIDHVVSNIGSMPSCPAGPSAFGGATASGSTGDC